MALSKEESNVLRQAVTTSIIAGYSRNELRQIQDIREENNCSEGEAYYLFALQKFNSIEIPENAIIYPQLKGGKKAGKQSLPEFKSTITTTTVS